MMTLLTGALAQVSGVTDYARFLGWVQAAVPKHPGDDGRPPPRRTSPVRLVFDMPPETVEANRSAYIFASELGRAFAYASRLELKFSHNDLPNLIVIIGEGYAEDGRLTEKFFVKQKFAAPMEQVLRRSSGWSECHTYVVPADLDTISGTISVMDDRLSQADKRKCILNIVINAFGLLIDPEHERAIEDFYPRYVTLAAARSKCAGPGGYEEHIRCIMDEFSVQK